MEQLDIGFWIQMLAYAVSFGVFYGKINTQIASLEKKVERHNGMIERTIALERDMKNAFGQIDDLKADLKGEKCK